MNQPLKILHLTTSLAVGGAERLILGLAEWTDRAHFETHICSLSIVRGNALLSDFERLKVPVNVIGAKRFYDPQAIRAVIRYIRQHDIDIIHTHLTDADIIGRVVGRLFGLPVVSTLQNEPRDYERQRYDRRWLERLTARYLTTQLVVVSDHIRTMFIKEWKIPAERINTIYNAVPVAQYLAIPAGTNAQAEATGPLITNIGRLSPQKAQHNLLAAAKIILAQRPGTGFMIVGQGRLEQQLKEQAGALGIADRVTFAGLRHDIPEVLAQSDIFVLSSLWEGLPLTAIEAMAAARPVVLTDVGGNRELMESGTHGLIIPPDDVPALAEALLSLLNDEPRRLALGQAAREQVRHKFNIEVVAKEYETLYKELSLTRPHSMPKPELLDQPQERAQ